MGEPRRDSDAGVDAAEDVVMEALLACFIPAHRATLIGTGAEFAAASSLVRADIGGKVRS
jgi:hypothetical protein